MMTVTQQDSEQHSIHNDEIFRTWRADIGTDRETTRRLVENHTPVVIWPDRDWIWLDMRNLRAML
jgi:hypothetical protein